MKRTDAIVCPRNPGSAACGCTITLKPSDVAGVWEGTAHYFGQDSRLVYVIAANQDGTLSVSTIARTTA